MPEKTIAVLRTFLCRYRNWRGLSQEEVANRAGLAVPTYRRLESFSIGEQAPAPTLRTVVQVLRAVGAEEDFLAALDRALTCALFEDEPRRGVCAPGGGRESGLALRKSSDGGDRIGCAELQADEVAAREERYGE